MAKQSYRDIISDLQKKQYSTVYFLSGEEPYFIDQIADIIQNDILTDAEKEFNQFVYYGKDVDLKQVLTQARQFPMMSKYVVILIKEAQHIDAKSLELLVTYLQHPQPSTILAFCYKKKLDARLKVSGELNKKGVMFVSEKLYDNQLPAFIVEYMKSKNVSIDNKSVQMMADHIGTDLHRLANELDKLIMTKPSDTKTITPDLIEKNIGISKEFNDFELKSAVAQRDIFKVNLIASHMSRLKSFSINVTIVTLYKYFANLMVYHYTQDKSPANIAGVLGVSPYFVKEYSVGAGNYNAWKTMQNISILREYDAMSKVVGNSTTSNPAPELLKEMLFKILH